MKLVVEILLIVLCASLSFASLHKSIQADLVVIITPFDGIIGDDDDVTYPVVGVNTLPPGKYNYGAPPKNASQVRVMSASAVVTIDTIGTGSETTTTTREWARSQGLPTDDAGHILANRMGGSGKEPINIFPQAPNINRGIYRMFEAKIAECVNATRNTASLSWSFTYDNLTLPTRPTSVYYCVNYSDSQSCTNTCQNFPN